MTFDEAIFCMKQYLPDSDSLECMKCPYYHSVPIEGIENGFTCKADEAHKKAIEALYTLKILRNGLVNDTYLNYLKGGDEMNHGKACAIFKDILNPALTDIERGEAIKIVINMETHNAITKTDMLEVIRYLWEMCFEVCDGGDDV